MIITAHSQPNLFKIFGSFSSIDHEADVRLLDNPDDLFCYHGDIRKTPTYILPYLFFTSLRKPETHDYCVKLLAELKEQKYHSLLESIITYGLIREVQASEMEVLMPYIQLNKTFKFDKFSAHHFYMGLTPLMLAKEQKTVDLFLSQTDLDLNVKAEPMQYWHQFEVYLAEQNGSYEKIKTKKDFLKIEGKNALEFSLLYKEKYKKSKLLARISPDEKNNAEKNNFDIIVNEPRVHIKKTQFIKQLFVNNQYLLNHLEDSRLKDVLVYQNKRQNNALFHAIKEGKKETVTKLISLGYFKGSDKTTHNEGYLEYAYNYGQTSLVLELFNNGLYCENENELRKLVCRKLDTHLYEASFFKNPKKEELGYAIKLGSTKVMDNLLNSSLYTLEEKKKAFDDYALFFLIGKTKSGIAELQYIERESSNSQKVYFQLMKHLMKIDKDHSQHYADTFLNSFKTQYLENKAKKYYGLDKEAMNGILSRLIKIIPSIKKQVFNTFFELEPENSKLVAIEKQIMNESIKSCVTTPVKRQKI